MWGSELWERMMFLNEALEETRQSGTEGNSGCRALFSCPTFHLGSRKNSIEEWASVTQPQHLSAGIKAVLGKQPLTPHPSTSSPDSTYPCRGMTTLGFPNSHLSLSASRCYRWLDLRTFGVILTTWESSVIRQKKFKNPDSLRLGASSFAATNQLWVSPAKPSISCGIVKSTDFSQHLSDVTTAPLSIVDKALP